MLLFAATQAGYWPLHFTINVTIMTLISAGIMAIVSLRDVEPDAEQVANGVWKPSMALAADAASGPLYADVRVHAVIVFAGVAGTLILFW